MERFDLFRNFTKGVKRVASVGNKILGSTLVPHSHDGYFGLPGRRRKWFRCNRPRLFNERDYRSRASERWRGNRNFLINEIIFLFYLSITGRATFSKTSSCVADSSNIR